MFAFIFTLYICHKKAVIAKCTNHAGNLLVQILDNQVYRLPGSIRGIFCEGISGLLVFTGLHAYV